MTCEPLSKPSKVGERAIGLENIPPFPAGRGNRVRGKEELKTKQPESPKNTHQNRPNRLLGHY